MDNKVYPPRFEYKVEIANTTTTNNESTPIKLTYKISGENASEPLISHYILFPMDNHGKWQSCVYAEYMSPKCTLIFVAMYVKH